MRAFRSTVVSKKHNKIGQIELSYKKIIYIYIYVHNNDNNNNNNNKVSQNVQNIT